MKTKLLVLFLFFSLVSAGSFASRLTHALGTSGYMIREAMQAKANKQDPENYYEALRLQREAKQAFRGTHKKGRDLKLAFGLTERAYAVAKQARDNSSPRYQNSKNIFLQGLKK